MGPGASVFILQAVRDDVFETPFRGPGLLIPLCLYSHGECGRRVWLRSSRSWLPLTTRDELFLPPPNHSTLTGFHLESESFVHKFACDTYICMRVYTHTHTHTPKPGRWLVWLIFVSPLIRVGCVFEWVTSHINLWCFSNYSTFCVFHEF